MAAGPRSAEKSEAFCGSDDGFKLSDHGVFYQSKLDAFVDYGPLYVVFGSLCVHKTRNSKTDNQAARLKVARLRQDVRHMRRWGAANRACNAINARDDLIIDRLCCRSACGNTSTVKHHQLVGKFSG